MPKSHNGSMRGRSHSVVARAAMSKVKSGVPKSAAHRKAISEAMKGRAKTEAHRAAIRKSVLAYYRRVAESEHVSA